MFNTKASPTPSPAKDSVSAKWSRKEHGTSAPYPAWQSPFMASPCPWTGNGKAMSAGSSQKVRVCVQSSSASRPCPRQCPSHVRNSLCTFRRVALTTSEKVRTMSISLDTPYPSSGPQRRFDDEHSHATICAFRGLGMSAHWPAGVRIKPA
jgi:hypothetical protein